MKNYGAKILKSIIRRQYIQCARDFANCSKREYPNHGYQFDDFEGHQYSSNSPINVLAHISQWKLTCQ